MCCSNLIVLKDYTELSSLFKISTVLDKIWTFYNDRKQECKFKFKL